MINNQPEHEMFITYANSRVFDKDNNLISSDIKIRNFLIQKNLKLVGYVLNRFFPKLKKSEEKNDIVQEGYLGLFSAVDRYEPSFGFKFSTYAIDWIKQSIRKYLAKNTTLKIPSHIQITKYRILKEMEKQGKTLKDFKSEDFKEYGLTQKMGKCIEISNRPIKTISLQDCISNQDDEKRKIEDMLSYVPNFENKMDDIKILDELQEAFEVLTDEEKTIVMLRYNVVDDMEKIYAKYNKK